MAGFQTFPFNSNDFIDKLALSDSMTMHSTYQVLQT